MDVIVILLLIVVIIGFAGIIGNQTATLRQLEQMQHTLERISASNESKKRDGFL
ncbi:hypothetical protein ACFP56_10160 [Paenibacillus septentrionalis]|uniref:Uncharacterized protein n=1 Tax=Paenibacillus septentrionalis TaxID=429342 RepID=A0ABW1V558_9BACL